MNHKISLKVMFYISMIFFTFNCKDKYLNIGEYYILPLAVIVSLILYFTFNLSGKRKQLYVKIEHICIVLSISYVLLSSLLINSEFRFDVVASYLIFFLLLFSTISLNLNQREVRAIITSYILSGMIFSLLLLIQLRRPYPGEMRFSIFYSDVDYYDVNFLAAYMLIPAILSFNRAIKLKKDTLIYIPITAVTILGILLTGSRASMIGLLFGLVAIVMRGKNSIGKNVMLTMVFLAIAYFLMPIELIERFFKVSYIKTNQRRLLHWYYGWEIFKSSPILGNGMIWTVDAIWDKFGVRYTAHNTFLAILIQFGIIGSLPFASILLRLYKSLIRDKSLFVVKTCYLVYLFVIFIIEACGSLVLFIPLNIIYLVVNYVKSNRYSKVEEVL